MTDEKYKVLVVEDQAMPRQLFEHFIETSSHFTLAGSIASAAFTEVYCLSRPINLILMDVITEGGENGLDEAEKIKKKFPKIKIIIVTSMPECSYIERAKKIGIEGFWYKETNEQPIIELMEKVMSGEIIYPTASHIVKIGLTDSSKFTKKELEVLRYVTGGFSNIEISERLNVSPGVIKNHIADMLQKTGFRSRTQLTVKARESGIVILNKDDEIL